MSYHCLAATRLTLGHPASSSSDVARGSAALAVTLLGLAALGHMPHEFCVGDRCCIQMRAPQRVRGRAGEGMLRTGIALALCPCACHNQRGLGFMGVFLYVVYKQSTSAIYISALFFGIKFLCRQAPQRATATAPMTRPCSAPTLRWLRCCAPPPTPKLPPRMCGTCCCSLEHMRSYIVGVCYVAAQGQRHTVLRLSLHGLYICQVIPVTTDPWHALVAVLGAAIPAPACCAC